jgi:hypothetical protein
VVTVDWGYETTMCLLSDGQLPIWDLSYELLSPNADIAKVRWMMEDRRNLFVGHAEGSEVFSGIHTRLAQIAAEAGLHKQVERIVRDRNGRARFEVARYEK